ncbi:MAG: glycosyl transferase [Proteobacteria bacterium]|nr:glycosyl transferase [Pseudomonadota bacterium]
MRMTRVFFYVQHLLGIGHLARASRIASAIKAAGMEITLVTGGMPVKGFPGPDVDHVALPAVAVGDGAFAGLVDADGNRADAAFLDRRRDLLLAAFHDAAPDVVITEAFPFGRRQMRFELLPLMAAIEARRPRPLLVASVRDILQEKTKPGRDEETVELVQAHYDRLLVHGDPSFVRLEDTFRLAAGVADKVAYTGLVCPPPPVPSAEQNDVVVSAGGGAVGAALVGAAIEAARAMPHLRRWSVITGPNLPDADYDAFAASAPANVTLHRFRTDFTSLLASARVSVSQAGYNTVADILQAGCRALLIPYAAQGETEQTTRATKLEALGRAVMLAETDLSGPAIATGIEAALAQDIAAGPAKVATDGARRSAEIIAEMVAAKR